MIETATFRLMILGSASVRPGSTMSARGTCNDRGSTEEEMGKDEEDGARPLFVHAQLCRVARLFFANPEARRMAARWRHHSKGAC
jgi:hypothetical protein